MDYAAAPQSRLEQLPVEVLEHTIEYLDATSVGALRLTCRGIARDSMGPRFVSFFHGQTTDLSRESLAVLQNIATHPTLGGAVRKLTIEATVYDSSLERRKIDMGDIVMGESLHSDGSRTPIKMRNLTPEQVATCEADVAWVHAREQAQDAFMASDAVIEALATVLAALGTLDVLELDACLVVSRAGKRAVRRRAWPKPVWDLASRTFAVTALALARSGVAVETLNVFRNTRTCSVRASDISDLLPAMEGPGSTFAASTGSRMKSLALSLSTPCRATPNYLDHANGGNSALPPAAKCHGVAELLALMPGLETLDLHLYSTAGPFRGYVMAHDRLFAKVADTVCLPALRILWLRGLPVTEASLLAFLENHPGIEELYLQSVRLTTGSWTPVLERIGAMPALEKLHLSSLYVSPGEGLPWGTLLNLCPGPPCALHYGEEERDFGALPKIAGKRLDKTLTWDGDGPRLVHTRDLSREDIRGGEGLLSFRPATGQPQSSRQRMRWCAYEAFVFGPPHL